MYTRNKNLVSLTSGIYICSTKSSSNRHIWSPIKAENSLNQTRGKEKKEIKIQQNLEEMSFSVSLRWGS